ncbi:LysR substrate binding domain protein [compost metagenome]
MEGQREGVIAGLGLALLPRHAVRRELELGVLRELPVAELPLLRSWCVVHPRGKYLSPVAQAFFSFVRNQRSQINALAERFAALTPESSPGS